MANTSQLEKTQNYTHTHTHTHAHTHTFSHFSIYNPRATCLSLPERQADFVNIYCPILNLLLPFRKS